LLGRIIHEVHVMQPDLNLLVVFNAIAETGSVTAAAERLSLSQPAVSHALNRLRDLTGDTLFVRAGNKMLATQRAQTLALKVRNIVADAKYVFALQTFSPESDTRRFVVAASDYAALTIAPALVARLRQRAPKTTIQFEAVGKLTLAALEEGQIDLSFWGALPPKKPLHWQRLWTEDHVAVVSKHHPLLSHTATNTVALSDYLNFPHISVSFHTPGGNRVDAALAACGVKRRQTVVTHSFSGVLRTIVGSDLIATLPKTLMLAVQSADHRVFELPFAVPSYEYGMVWHERCHRDPALEWLRSQLVECAQSAPQIVKPDI
jgi:DNA-binding transcriptional LysR family regulator